MAASINPIENINTAMEQLNSPEGLSKLVSNVAKIVASINKAQAADGLKDFNKDTFNASKASITNAMKGMQAFFKAYNNVVNDTTGGEGAPKKGLLTLCNSVKELKLNTPLSKAGEALIGLYTNISTSLDKITMDENTSKVLDGKLSKLGDTKRAVTKVFSNISSMFAAIQNTILGKDEKDDTGKVVKTGVGSFESKITAFSNTVNTLGSQKDNLKTVFGNLCIYLQEIVEGVTDGKIDNWIDKILTKEQQGIIQQSQNTPSQSKDGNTPSQNTPAFILRKNAITKVIKEISRFFIKIADETNKLYKVIILGTEKTPSILDVIKDLKSVEPNIKEAIGNLYGFLSTVIDAILSPEPDWIAKFNATETVKIFEGGKEKEKKIDDETVYSSPFAIRQALICNTIKVISKFFTTVSKELDKLYKVVFIGDTDKKIPSFLKTVSGLHKQSTNITEHISNLYGFLSAVIDAILSPEPDWIAKFNATETVKIFEGGEEKEKKIDDETVYSSPFAIRQALICNTIKVITGFFTKVSKQLEKLNAASTNTKAVIVDLNPKDITNTIEILYGALFNIIDSIMNPDNTELWEGFFKDNYRDKLDKNGNPIFDDKGVTQQEKYSIFGDKQKLIIGAITSITKLFKAISSKLPAMNDAIKDAYEAIGKISDPTIIIKIIMGWIQRVYRAIMKYNIDLIELNERIQALQGIFAGLSAIFDVIGKLKITPVTLIASIISVKMLGILVEEIDNWIQGFKNADFSKAIIQITQLVEIFRGISGIYQALNSISLTTLLLAHLKMKLINSMFNSVGQKGNTDELGGFFDVLDSINKISITSALLIGKKIEILTKSGKLIVEFINTIQSSFEQFDVNTLEQINYKLTLIGAVLNSYLDLLDIFVKIKIKGYLKILGKIDTKPLTKAIFKLADEIVKQFSDLDKKKLNKSHKNIKLLLGIFKSFKAIMITLMLLVPIGALFIMMSPLIIIMVIITAFILNLIFRVINVILSAKLAASTFTKIIGVIAGLILVAAALILLGLLAPLALKAFIPALALLGAVVVILTITVLIGFAVQLAGPLLMAGTVGILTAVFIVFLLLAIVAMIYLIGEITLDVDKIMKNVRAVLGVVFGILELMLDPDGVDTDLDLLKNGKDKNEQAISESEDSWLVIAGKFIGNIIGKIVGAIVSVVVLLFAVIAVASILLIASMLRLLQELNLDPAKITKNVAVVMWICDQIIRSIFTPMDPTENANEPSKGSDVGNIIGWICAHVPGLNILVGMMEIINSLLAFGYLAIMTFAILCITLIASMLRLIQELDLNPTKIIENVDIVMSTCDKIINSIFIPSDPTADTKKPTKGDDMGNIVGWICEHVPGINILVGIMQIVNSLMALGYLIIMTFAVLCITLIIFMLKYIQDAVLNSDAILKNVNAVMWTCEQIINSIFIPSDPTADAKEPAKGSDMGKIIGWICAHVPGLNILVGMMNIVNSLMALGYLVILTVSILAVVLLAWILKSLVDNYKLEDIIFAGILGTEIIKAAKSIQMAVFFGSARTNYGENSSDSIGQKVWDALGTFFINIPGVKLLSSLMALGNISHMVMGILLIMMLGNLLSKLANINIPNIKNLGQFARDIITAAKETAKAAFNLKFDLPEDAVEIADQMLVNSILSGISKLIPGLTSDMGAIKNIPSIGMIIGGIGAIKAVGIALMSLGSISINAEDIRNKLQNINTALPFLCESLTIIDSYRPNVDRVNKNLNLIKKLHEIIPGLTHVTQQDVKNSKDLTDNYIAFLTKVNSMDFTKLKTTEQLMKHWADMSRTINGNFQGLAQAINEHIMPTLKSLNKTMDESMKVQKQIIDDLSKPIDASRMVNDTPGVPPIGSPSDGRQAGAPTNTGSPDGGGYSGYSPSSSSYPTTSSQSGIDITPDEESSYTTDNFGYDDKKEPIGDGPSFINPYVRNTDKQRKSALERLTKALDGDALRVKIIN